MNSNRLIRVLLSLMIFGCITSCKKNKPDGTPTIDNEITYELSNTIFPNPERGFIRTMIVKSGGNSLDLAQLKTFRNQNVSMIVRVFYLDAFKSQPISAAQLTLIQTDLDKLRDAGLKAILRFAYTDDMAGSDAPLTIINQHIDQLKPVFETNKDIIAFVQAGFIGAYGEWHSSSNGLATVENERAVLTKLLSALPAGIMVQVRTPVVKQLIFNSPLPIDAAMAYTSENRARVGHHNDCFLSGGTDYGTYTNVLAEKQYISTEALYVPTGGETCPPTGGYNPTCFEGRNEMKLLKWTYLNLDWYPATINAWRTSGCFDEFQTNLGYRIALVSSTIPAKTTTNGSLPIIVNLTNNGYAPLYNKKDSYLVLKNKTSGQYYEIKLAFDMRIVKPLATIEVKESLSLQSVPAGEYNLYLRVADNAASLKSRIEYAVRFGNADTWVEENGGMNNLKHSLTIQ
ncbi:MAG: DUF4832 domain-containing protein [Bacteroidota bacterium]